MYKVQCTIHNVKLQRSVFMTFTNIQICNINDKLNLEEIEQKIIKFKESSGYRLVSNENGCDNVFDYIKIIYNQNSKFITVFDSSFSFKSTSENKSYIRKLAKALTLPVFCISCFENEHIIIEQYNFNKRIYDYLSIGDLHKKMVENGYEDMEYFNKPEIWQEFFVGRNSLENINEVIKQSKEYSDKSYIVEQIFKLYGLNKDMSLYNETINNYASITKTLYFTKIM